MSVSYKMGTDHQEKHNVMWDGTGYSEKQRGREQMCASIPYSVPHSH